jgi:cellulose synthase/poly-beta-1,6-N-acetylglucosamine synthase-like glycosyltransferase
VLWFWVFVAPALVLALAALRGERTRAEYVAARMAELEEPAGQRLPCVAVIIPVTGSRDGLRDTLRTLASQDYPDYELIVAAPHADSIPPGVLPSVVKIALGGEASRINLLEVGVRAARRRAEVFAFAGSTGVVSKLWLRALVAPLSGERVGVSTGFRWYAPDPPAFWPLVQSVWNGVIAGRLGPGGNDFAWGGAIAISKSVFFQGRVAEAWEGAERDDLALVRAMRESGRLIAFAPGALVVCGGCATTRQFLRQACREMALARSYLPRLWWQGLVSHVIYCGAMLAAVIASVRGNRGAEWALVALFGLGMLKGANRATLAKAQLPQWKTWFDRYGWTHTFWVPLVTWVWLFVLVASTFRRSDAEV